MYTFLTQIADTLRSGTLYYFSLLMIFVWGRIIAVHIVSRKYRPVDSNFSTSTSVIVPVVDESVALFYEVLSSIQKQKPDEVIVVFNGSGNQLLENACQVFSDEIKLISISEASKRKAIAKGLEVATGELCILVDSDTIWQEDLLKEIQKPFCDSLVGGVTSKQSVHKPNRNIITRMADWMEEIRFTGTMPAMSTFGKVGCLPGRTIAFRTEILREVIDDFLNEKFLGIHKEVSDDRSLTNLTLKKGFKTVYQSTAKVATDAPIAVTSFLSQQVRWAEGSQYNNLKMFHWMRKNAKFMFFLYVSDMAIPFLMLANILIWFSNRSVVDTHGAFVQNTPLIVHLIFSLIGATFIMSVRQGKRLQQKISDIIYVPIFVLFVSIVMLPVRVIGFYKLADDRGWRTRKGAYRSKRGLTFSGLYMRVASATTVLMMAAMGFLIERI